MTPAAFKRPASLLGNVAMAGEDLAVVKTAPSGVVGKARIEPARAQGSGAREAGLRHA